MKKFAFVFALLSLVGGTQTASAQYYQTSACTTLTQTLSTGSRGSEVLTLQTFLSNQDYKGGGAWMITGYFGAATRQAVRNFQATQNLPVTGVVDAATRAAISSVTCGNVGPSSYYQAPYSYSTELLTRIHTPATSTLLNTLPSTRTTITTNTRTRILRTTHSADSTAQCARQHNSPFTHSRHNLLQWEQV